MHSSITVLVAECVLVWAISEGIYSAFGLWRVKEKLGKFWDRVKPLESQIDTFVYVLVSCVVFASVIPISHGIHLRGLVLFILIDNSTAEGSIRLIFLGI